MEFLIDFFFCFVCGGISKEEELIIDCWVLFNAMPFDVILRRIFMSMIVFFFNFPVSSGALNQEKFKIHQNK